MLKLCIVDCICHFFGRFLKKAPQKLSYGKVLRSFKASSTIVSAMFALHSRGKFWSSFFKSLRRSRARSPWRSPQRAKPFIVRKTQERVNLFAKQIKRENPRRGFSLVFSKATQFVAKSNSYTAFSFDTESAKEKANKKKTLFLWALPKPASF